MAAPERDTDADWRELGQTNPYWAVLSHPDYLPENLTPANLEAFYGTGRTWIDETVDDLERASGAKPKGGRALDFGCGVGRLAEAMTAYADEVVGYDVSPGMLRLARQRGGKASYADTLPDGPFDWINSLMVFQHIEPVRGLPILEQLLARLAPEGFVSLHLTVWFDPRHHPRRLGGWRGKLDELARRRWLAGRERGIILMYEYDMSAVIRLLNLAGVEKMRLHSTDHDGHHGVIILGRKAAQTPPNA